MNSFANKEKILYSLIKDVLMEVSSKTDCLLHELRQMGIVQSFVVTVRHIVWVCAEHGDILVEYSKRML